MGPDQHGAWPKPKRKFPEVSGSFRKFPEVSGSFRKFPEVSANLLGKLFLKVLFSEQFLGGQPIVMIPFDAPLWGGSFLSKAFVKEFLSFLLRPFFRSSYPVLRPFLMDSFLLQEIGNEKGRLGGKSCLPGFWPYENFLTEIGNPKKRN